MRNGRDHGSLMPMSRQALNIRCEIDSFDGSIRGQLENEQGTSRSFSGWTEFATALMALVRDTKNIKHETNNKEKEA